MGRYQHQSSSERCLKIVVVECVMYGRPLHSLLPLLLLTLTCCPCSVWGTFYVRTEGGTWFKIRHEDRQAVSTVLY